MNEETIIKNAVITSATLEINDKGILDAWIFLDYGGTGQGFGGYCLYLPKSFKHHDMQSVAGHYLYRIMQIADVEKWDRLPGKSIRVKGTWNTIEAIGHIIKDDWFNPKADFEAAKLPTRNSAP